MKPVEALHATRWHAALDLRFEADDERTWLSQRRHSGPLVVQRSFYPEDRKLCQMVIVHPPGGIAGGDELAVTVSARERAQVQLTTPGAGKWYRGFGRDARQSVQIDVGAGAMCEWLPQENIVFDGALARMSLEVELADDALFCGWEFTCLGRPHSQESFDSGMVRQRMSIRRQGRALFREQAFIDAAKKQAAAPSMLGENCAYGSMVIAGKRVEEPAMGTARSVFENVTDAGVTCIGEVLIARWVGNNVQAGRELFTRLWAVLRPWYARRDVVIPRIWAT
ncbi:MAG: urease accessory protein UreD [Burkholderiales bacterium]|jgi:urease accessory protein